MCRPQSCLPPSAARQPIKAPHPLPVYEVREHATLAEWWVFGTAWCAAWREQGYAEPYAQAIKFHMSQA